MSKAGSGGGDSRIMLIVAVAIGLLASLLERSAPRLLGVDGTAAPSRRPAEAVGRLADSPAQIPARGWWQVLKRVATQFNDHRIMTEAAAVTFFGLLSLFPALASFVSLYGFVADPRTLSDQLETLRGVIPSGGLQIMSDELHALTGGNPTALGFGFIVGLGTSLWSANAGVKSLFDALNVVYDETEKRSFIWRTVLSFCFTLGMIVFTILALVAVVVVPVVLNFVGLGDAFQFLLGLSRWPLLIVLLTAVLALLYRYGPSRRPAKWRWVSWGGVVATVLWVVASALFSWYVAQFGSYNKTYGSLGAVAGFMTWIWISSMVILLGAELDAELEHQTTRDTTEGPPRPMGQRGATKADRVAGHDGAGGHDWLDDRA